ncbi:MAG TPA: NADH-quinone oxidoreductase subunit L [Dehalococcoidia bacterium]|nr:NADH-quinone oxidoreductase subunit L [Dehalococcoidia bacterium]
MTDAWVLPVLPAAAFVALLLFSTWLPRKGDWLAILAMAASFALVFPIGKDVADSIGSSAGFQAGTRSWEWAHVEAAGHTYLDIRIGTYVDQITLVMLFVVTLVALLVMIYSTGYMRGDRRYGWFYAIVSLFVASMLTLVLADNLLMLYFAWELVGLCSMLLIGYYNDRQSAAEASKKAFVTTRVGDVGLLIGIIILFTQTHTFNIQQILHMAEAGEISKNWLTAAAVLIFAGACGKSAQFPLHVWLPDAMEGPTPVSALIHAATMVVAGVYLVARMLPLMEVVRGMPELITALALTTVILSALIGLAQRDIKRVVAYSTLNSLGLMFVALGSGAVGAAMLYLFVHAFFKALLFLTCGSVIHATEEQEVDKLGGLWDKLPITAPAFIVGALAMAGMIPFSGFWAKDEILVGLHNGNMTYIALITTLISLPITAIYMMRVVMLTFFGTVKDEHVHEHAHESEPVMSWPLILLSVLAVVAGFVVFEGVGKALGFHSGWLGFIYNLGEGPEKYATNWGLATASVVLVVLGLLFGMWMWRGEAEPSKQAGAFSPLTYKLFLNRFYIDEVYQFAIDKIVLAAGRVIAVFDRTVVNDTGVNGTGDATWGLGWTAKFQETGKIPNYAFAIVAGIVIIVAIAFGYRA